MNEEEKVREEALLTKGGKEVNIPEAIKNLRRQLALRIGNISLADAIRSGDKRATSIQLGIEAQENLQNLRDLIGNLKTDYKLPQAVLCLIERIEKPLPSEGEKE